MRTQHRKTIGLVAAGALIVGGITGCSNPIRDLQERAVESGIERLIESGTGVESADLFSTELPESFPSAVPVPDAELVAAFHATQDGVTGWSLSYQVEGTAVFDRYVVALPAAGFDEVSSGSMGDAMSMALFESDAYSVGVTLIEDGSSGMLQVIVTSKGD